MLPPLPCTPNHPTTSSIGWLGREGSFCCAPCIARMCPGTIPCSHPKLMEFKSAEMPRAHAEGTGEMPPAPRCHPHVGSSHRAQEHWKPSHAGRTGPKGQARVASGGRKVSSWGPARTNPFIILRISGWAVRRPRSQGREMSEPSQPQLLPSPATPCPCPCGASRLRSCVRQRSDGTAGTAGEKKSEKAQAGNEGGN